MLSRLRRAIDPFLLLLLLLPVVATLAPARSEIWAKTSACG